MNLCKADALEMPCSYTVLDEREMTYTIGGGSAVVYDTAEGIRKRLTVCITSTTTAEGTITALSTLGGPLAAIAAFVVSNGTIGSYRSAAASAHAVVERIIARKGKNANCKMTTTYSTIFYCTGVTVETV